jgi:hypothetical protein
MNTVQINKSDLIKAIKENCSKFGDSFLGLYVDVDGDIDCTDLNRSGNSMLILGFGGMGEFTDSEGRYSDDDNYDAQDVAEYIVGDQECLMWGGTILEDDGSEADYKFNVYDQSKMTIESVEMSGFGVEDETTVSVLVHDSNNNSEKFHIQTVDNECRGDLGCWIITDLSDGDIDCDEYPQFDIDLVVSKAEEFIKSRRVEKHTDYIIDNESAYLIVKHDSVDVVTRNSAFINSDTSSYQREFSDAIKTFGNEAEALAYLEEL